MSSHESAWSRCQGESQDVLSGRESSILAAAATGRNVREVSELCGHEPGTVRQALASAIHKLGARSKLEAIIIAHERGLIALS